MQFGNHAVDMNSYSGTDLNVFHELWSECKISG